MSTRSTAATARAASFDPPAAASGPRATMNASRSVEAPHGLINKRPSSAMKRSSTDLLQSVPENRLYLGASPTKAHQIKAPSTSTLPEDATAEMFMRPDFVTSTSYDERHPVGDCVVQDTQKFWVSTGLFPHEITLMFQNSVLLTRVVVASWGVRSMTLQWSLASSGSWRELREPAIPPGSDHSRISHTFDIGGSPCDKLILRIDSAYDAFCIVFMLECWGTPPEHR